LLKLSCTGFVFLIAFQRVHVTDYFCQQNFIKTAMKKALMLLCGICLGTLFLSSCIVSKKRYLEATARADKEHADNVQLTNQLTQANETIARQNSENLALNNRITMLRDSIQTLENKADELNGKISELGSENQSASKQLKTTKAEINAQRERLEHLQAMIDAQKRAAEALRKKIAEALEGFNSSELTVTMKNGRVYISMQESLLFPSGSAEVNPKGKEALAKVASVLNTSSDINIDVEGHTDSLPIHNRLYADNWALSTARATSIAHVLIDDYKVNPAKLIASGRSQYDPVAPNSTPEGRGLNRRTEIILEPKLDELMQLVNGVQ
jgi:chemotaxis protein MotB